MKHVFLVVACAALLATSLPGAADDLPAEVNKLPPQDRQEWKNAADVVRSHLFVDVDGKSKRLPADVDDYFVLSTKRLNERFASAQESYRSTRSRETAREIEKYKSELAAAKAASRQILFPVAIERQEVGRMGTIAATVVQIPEKGVVIAKDRWNQKPFWVDGLDTGKMTDGDALPSGVIYRVVGTKSYESTSGANSTILRAVVVDPKMFASIPDYKGVNDVLSANGLAPNKVAAKSKAARQKKTSVADDLLSQIPKTNPPAP